MDLEIMESKNLAQKLQNQTRESYLSNISKNKQTLARVLQKTNDTTISKKIGKTIKILENYLPELQIHERNAKNENKTRIQLIRDAFNKITTLLRRNRDKYSPAEIDNIIANIIKEAHIIQT